MKHALVVGGSGMLAKTSIWLADNGYKVSVIGRDRYKLNKLSEMSDNIIPISVDYYNERLFRSNIRNAITTNGSYDLVVAWIHSKEREVIDMISSEITTVKEWSLFHVLGSSSNLENILNEINYSENCDYHQVQLGFVIENNKSRWLTHDEISNGVINCIRTNAKKYLVGTLTPWDKKP
ncbi:short-chain dehydrogenase [Paenibacillus spongiae]|uniref:Short-chain dehydrogenase n=1 Tax=Paenibacillus spongiae TaxID=2909671 RepID=A0ABY5SKQ9_9BACL|nr:short-chain dehydrogenase [Paenibacillus spongiae]UVI33105.1 short-chain dehydrogenase [Paenibacillus spongiae]